MSRTIRHQLIKRLQAELPRGAPFGLATLELFGVSPQLAARYVEEAGSYASPMASTHSRTTTLMSMARCASFKAKWLVCTSEEKRVGASGGPPQPGIVGHPRSLGRCPFRHTYLVHRAFSGALCRGQALRLARRYSRRKDPAHSPGQPEGLQVAVPERAVLELLYDAGTRQSLEECRNIFDGLRSPRKDLLGQLLSCCTSVKAVRLFLTWARESGVVDVDLLLEHNQVRTGSSRRWMSRLDDGTLLSLNPHG